jgi:transposase
VAAVRQWLRTQSEAFRAEVTHVVIDPSAAYAAAVSTELLPNAVLVVDHFHLVKLANDPLTSGSPPVTFDTHGRRGRAQDPEWANRRRLLTARERLSHRAFAAMWNALIDNDSSSQILAAYIAKEELRQLLAAARDQADDAEIRTRLYRFYSWCADTKIPEVARLATTIETWWPAILAFLHTGLTNARIEGSTGWSNRSNASPAASATPRTHAAGSTAPAPSGPASDSPPRNCPANFEEPV